MKKAKGGISKNAWNVAKQLSAPPPATGKSDAGGSLSPHHSIDDSSYLQKLEDEVMGEVKDSDTLKSKALERNLNQMIDVLHLRLAALETAAKVRMEFCSEDLLPNSNKMSKLAPKIMEEFEDQNVFPKALLRENNAKAGAQQAKVSN